MCRHPKAEEGFFSWPDFPKKDFNRIKNLTLLFIKTTSFIPIRTVLKKEQMSFLFPGTLPKKFKMQIYQRYP